MKKTIEKILNNRYFLLALCLLLSFLITFPALAPALNVDAYCNIYGGYLGTARHFMKSGRAFTALAFTLANYVKLSFKNFSLISIVLSNIFLSLSVHKLYIKVKKIVASKSNITNLLLLVGSFLFICNPLSMEFFLFQEGFIMWMGVYFIILASINALENKKLSYLKVLIYLCAAATCYQGIVCFFLPTAFLLYYLQNRQNINLKDITKKFILLTFLYGLSLIFTFIVVKVVNNYIFTEATARLGKLDLLYNVRKFFELCIFSLMSLFGMANRIVYYGVGILLSLIIFCFILKDKSNNKLELLFIVFNVLLCCMTPFIPNLALNKESNYTAARMIGTLGSIHGLIIIYGAILFNNKNTKILKLSFIALSLIYFVYNGINYINALNINNNRYQRDMESIEKIQKQISLYEKESGNVVQNIYYATDSYVDYFYYDNRLNNSYNYRLYAIDWAMTCAVNMDKSKQYNYELMTEEKKQELFNNKEYDAYSNEQYVFEGNSLYLLIF